MGNKMSRMFYFDCLHAEDIRNTLFEASAFKTGSPYLAAAVYAGMIARDRPARLHFY